MRRKSCKVFSLLKMPFPCSKSVSYTHLDVYKRQHTHTHTHTQLYFDIYFLPVSMLVSLTAYTVPRSYITIIKRIINFFCKYKIMLYKACFRNYIQLFRESKIYCTKRINSKSVYFTTHC